MSHTLKKSEYDCIVPTWKIEGQDVKSWSVVSVDNDTFSIFKNFNFNMRVSFCLGIYGIKAVFV